MKWINLVNSRKRAVVDNRDWGMLSQFRWSLIRPKPGAEYAETYIGYCSVRMHNLILPSAKMVDHKDRDGLNNRRSNLRPCDHSQNRANSIKQRQSSTSKYKGVCWNRAAKMWKSHIGSNGQRVFLGYFKDEGKAAKAYNKAARKFFGKFARLNDV